MSADLAAFARWLPARPDTPRAFESARDACLDLTACLREIAQVLRDASTEQIRPAAPEIWWHLESVSYTWDQVASLVTPKLRTLADHAAAEAVEAEFRWNGADFHGRLRAKPHPEAAYIQSSKPWQPLERELKGLALQCVLPYIKGCPREYLSLAASFVCSPSHLCTQDWVRQILTLPQADEELITELAGYAVTAWYSPMGIACLDTPQTWSVPAAFAAAKATMRQGISRLFRGEEDWGSFPGLRYLRSVTDPVLWATRWAQVLELSGRGAVVALEQATAEQVVALDPADVAVLMRSTSARVRSRTLVWLGTPAAQTLGVALGKRADEVSSAVKPRTRYRKRDTP